VPIGQGMSLFTTLQRGATVELLYFPMKAIGLPKPRTASFGIKRFRLAGGLSEALIYQICSSVCATFSVLGNPLA